MHLPTSLDEALFLLPVLLFRSGQSFFSSVLSTMLLDLLRLLNEEFKNMTVLFANRSLGAIIGAVTGSLYIEFKPFYNKLDPISICAVLSILSCATIYLIPTSTELIFVQICVTVATACFGFTEITLQSIIIKTWGPERSQPILQGFHMVYNLGSTIGPVVVAYFVSETPESSCDCHNMVNITALEEDLLPDERVYLVSNLTSVNNSDGLLVPASSFDAEVDASESQIHLPFLISTFLIGLSSLFFLYNGIKFKRFDIEKIIHQQGLEMVEPEPNSAEKIKAARERTEKYERKEKPFFKYRFWMLILTSMLYFGIGGSLHWYGDSIYNYATCVLRWSKMSSTLMQSVFWGTCTLSGCFGMYLVSYLGPRLYSFIDSGVILLGFTIATLAISDNFQVVSESAIPGTIWGVNIALGLAYGTIYAAGISWVASDYLNVTQFYFLFFILGDFVGQIPLKRAAEIISCGAKEDFYLVELGYVSGTIAVMLLMLFLGKYR